MQAYQHRPKEELFDLRDDPYEMKNLANNPEYSELLKSLRTQLAEWCEQQGDILPIQRLTEFSVQADSQ